MADDKILETLPDLVLGYWEEHQKPWLLSSLGGRIGAEARERARRESATLAEYIELKFPDTVRIVTIPGHDKAAAPKDRVSDLSDANLVQAFRSKRGKSVSKRSYARNVWKAFFRPITQGYRYIQIAPEREPLLHEVEEKTIRENWFEVTSADLAGIVGLSGSERTKAIEAAIVAWADKAGVNIDDLCAPRDPKNGFEPLNQKGGTLSTLLKGLEVLEPSELARVSVPGDVFLSVLRRLA